MKYEFNDLAKGKFTFAIKDIKAEIKGSDIKAAMDSIIAKEIFVSKGGSFESKAEA
ncbi:DUF2922 domain-containing protein [Clostridium gasigenes]|uniref:DUF2922 domain-containing protein n=1 Tax=Clostridium gasigenes TaxID=94869 RepID=UPI001C0C4187|nr:DUF2922 domain-containing protein [Clostridium gasigenes]